MDTANDFLIYLDGFLGSAVWFPALLLLTGLFFLFIFVFHRFVTSGMPFQLRQGSLIRKGPRVRQHTFKHFLRPSLALSVLAISGCSSGSSLGGTGCTFLDVDDRIFWNDQQVC